MTTQYNKKLYCSCRKTYTGKKKDKYLIKCYNISCRFEWFHPTCMGLTSHTEHHNKWLCNECQAKVDSSPMIEEVDDNTQSSCLTLAQYSHSVSHLIKCPEKDCNGWFKPRG